LSSGGAEALQRGHLAHEEVHDLRVPLVSGAADQNCQRVIDREPRPVRAIVDKCVERVADRDDTGQARDFPSAKSVGIVNRIARDGVG